MIGRVLLILLILGSGASAEAGGLYAGDIGARGMARGGALVAAPDDLLAIHYNPAGLSGLRGLHLLGSYSLVAFDATFTRACPCLPAGTPNGAALDAELAASFGGARSSSPIGIPFFGIGYGVPFLDLAVAFAAFGPHAGKHDFGALSTGPGSRSFIDEAHAAAQRYSVLSTDPIELNLAFGVAFSPLPGLRVGATLSLYSLGIRQSRHIWVNIDGAQEAEDPQFDAPSVLDFTSGMLAGWAAGVSYELLPGLHLGSSFRATRRIDAAGTIDTGLPAVLREGGDGALLGARVAGRDVTVELALAPIWRAGIEYRLEDVFRAELAVVWEGWSVHDQIVIRPQDIAIELAGTRQPLGDIIIPRGWRDTWSVRAGGELDVLAPELTLRAGWFFEPAAIPAERLEPGQIDLPKHAFSAGVASRVLGYVELELAAALLLLDARDVSTSEIALVAPLEAPLGTERQRTVVGNGAYRARYVIIALGATTRFDL